MSLFSFLGSRNSGSEEADHTVQKTEESSSNGTVLLPKLGIFLYSSFYLCYEGEDTRSNANSLFGGMQLSAEPSEQRDNSGFSFLSKPSKLYGSIT
jgi:hypothetical protein